MASEDRIRLAGRRCNVKMDFTRTLSYHVLELTDSHIGEIEMVEDETALCPVSEGLDDADGDGGVLGGAEGVCELVVHGEGVQKGVSLFGPGK